MAFIIIFVSVIYIILIIWTWYSLGDIERQKKIVYSVIGIILMYIISLIIFNFSKQGILYDNINIQGDVRNMLVFLFTAINGIIVMPQVAKLLDKINEGQIKKNQIVTRVGILLTIFIICIIFETGYMKDMQEGILKIYHQS